MKLSINSALLTAGTLLGALLVYFLVVDEDSGRGPLAEVKASVEQLSQPSREAEPDALASPDAKRGALESQRSEMKQFKTKRQLAKEVEAIAEAEQAEQGPMLFGTLYDEHGFAIAGAEVEVSAQGKAKNLLGMIVDNFSKKTTSDAAGNFEVPRSWIAKDEVKIKVAARGFQIMEEERAPSAPEGRADLGILQLTSAVILAGHVTDATGAPVEAADVMRTERGGEGADLFFARMGGSKLSTTSTDAEGYFELAHEEVGDYDLIVKHAEYPQKRFEGRTPEAGGEDLGIVIRMDASESISGRITGFPKGMQRISVQATPAVRGEDEQLRGIALFIPAADAKSPTAQVAADGSFQIDGLVPSKFYVVKALQQKGFMGHTRCSDELEVLSGNQELSLTWEKGASLSFAVEDQTTGEPIDVGSARFLWLEEESMMGNMALSRKFDAGRVYIEELRPDPAPGKLQVLLYAPGYQEYKIESISIDKGQDCKSETIRMQPAAMLSVRVLDASSGEPLRRAYVELEPIQASAEDGSFIDGRKSDGNTDEEGRVSLESCITEMARMTVKKGGYGTFKDDALAMPRTGTQELLVELIPGGTLEAFVVDRAGRPVKNSRVFAILSDAERRMEDTNSSGRARFTNLPPGMQRLRGERHLESTKKRSFSTNRKDNYDEDLDWTEVMVSSRATSKIELVVPSASTLGGRITAGGRALAEASVRVLQKRESKAEMDQQFEVESSMDGAFSGVSSSVKTDSKGVFSISEIPLGEHVLYVVSQSGSLPHSFPVEIIEGNNYVDLELPVANVGGLVVDAEGKPISGVKISARRVDEKSPEGGGDLELFRSMFGRQEQGSVNTDFKGVFSIPNVAPDVPLTISANKKGYIRAFSGEMSVKPGEQLENVRIELARAGSIRVNLISSGARFVMLQATYAGDEKNKPEDTQGRGWAQGGSGLIEGLAPGLWRVSIDDSEGLGQLVEVHAGSQAQVSL